MIIILLSILMNQTEVTLAAIGALLALQDRKPSQQTPSN